MQNTTSGLWADKSLLHGDLVLVHRLIFVLLLLAQASDYEEGQNAYDSHPREHNQNYVARWELLALLGVDVARSTRVNWRLERDGLLVANQLEGDILAVESVVADFEL